MKKNLKLVLLLVIACITLNFVPTSSYAYVGYTEPSTWAKTAVRGISESGMAEGSFLIDYSKAVQRQEFAMLAVKLYEKAAGRKAAEPSGNNFTDSKNVTYSKYIEQAYRLGIVKGVSADKFNPYGLVTRQEICVMLTRFLKAVQPSENYIVVDDIKFKDNAQIASWARNDVLYAYKNKIMSGVAELTIAPLQNTTREQAITLIYRLAIAKGFMNPASDEIEGTYNLNGYTIPKDTMIAVDGADFSTKTELDLGLRITKPLEKQYQDLKVILTSRFGEENASKVLEFVKLKTTRNDDLGYKNFYFNGNRVFVACPWGWSISIIVHQPGV